MVAIDRDYVIAGAPPPRSPTQPSLIVVGKPGATGNRQDTTGT